MKKLIVGGSFDPIHNGHIQIALKAKEIYSIDKVVFMIAKNPRWKETNASSVDRLEMLKLALTGYKNFEISLLEYNSSEEINYTFDTMTKYHALNPEDELYFLIGYDQLDKFDKWYKADELSSLVHLVSFARPDFIANEKFAEKYDISIIREPISNMSSTAFRECSLLNAPKKVIDYVIEHELYFVPKIRSYIKEKRYIHSVNVANTAYKIALGNNFNPNKAYLAGLLHDIGKYVDLNEQVKIVKEYDETLVSVLSPQVYHEFTGAKLVTTDFNIHDEEIIHAIRFHATGCSEMGILDKIIYAADKIEPGRGYDSSSLIELCEKNLDEGFKKVLEENILFFKKNSFKDYHNPLTNGCLEKYLK